MSNYKFEKNTYYKDIKPNWEDRLEVEVGDIKKPDLFYPQIKVKRWDNEVNFSVRLKDDDYPNATVEYVGEKIKWTKGKREAHLYDLPPKEDDPLLEDGGYEFEITLLEKPATNVIEFSIETKGVDCFYQPELTPEQKAVICVGGDEPGYIQPENVIGSYAIYYKDVPANYVGEKLYRVGKVCHIFRPKIIDSAGTEVWGELYIDENKKLLTVTIPQDFLNNAVYPVRHAAGFQMGFTGIGGATVTYLQL